jgi:hypothetical protein
MLRKEQAESQQGGRLAIPSLLTEMLGSDIF